jgi:hypothetical protein
MYTMVSIFLVPLLSDCTIARVSLYGGVLPYRLDLIIPAKCLWVPER